MALLEAWKKLRGDVDDEDAIVLESEIGCEAKRLATAVRDEDLKAAKVTRAILFEEDAAER